MPKSNNITFLLLSFMIVTIGITPAFSSPDKWGGDDRVKDSTTFYQTGTATSVGSWTLTDTSKSWTANALAGQILQPFTGTEVYYLIKSNTSNTITVYGSDTDGNEERAYRHVSDDGATGRAYAVLNQWKTRKVGGRWWMFDPSGNSFFLKAINKFGAIYQSGQATDTTNIITNINNKFGGSHWSEGFTAAIDTYKSFGFNSAGSIVDYAYSVPGSAGNATLTASRYMPFLAQVRIDEVVLPNTPRVPGMGNLWDATDSHFQADIQTTMLSQSGAATDGIKAFNNRTWWQASFLAPYQKAKYQIAANPYYIGIDWGEEPGYAVSESENNHMGYYILVSSGAAPCKQRAVAYLQSAYVTIGALNTAWRSSFSSWTQLQSDTGTLIKPLLSSAPYVRSWGVYTESNARMKADLDGIATDFWSVYTGKVKAALDSLIATHKLNMSPAYHGWWGDNRYAWAGTVSPIYLFRGSKGNVDVIGLGDPMHGPHSSVSEPIYTYMGPALKAIYDEVQLPMYHESTWLTAEADSGLTVKGTITGLTATTMTDGTKNFQYSFGSAGTYDSTGYWWLDLNTEGVPQANRKYFRIKAGGTGARTLTVDLMTGPGSNWGYSYSPDMTTYASVGQSYKIISNDIMQKFYSGSYNLFIPLTQSDRAIMYVNFLNEMIWLKSDTSSDYFMVGYCHWSIFDQPFFSDGGERRNWGFFSAKANRYDGVEATVANGEPQNCGNFVGPVSIKLRGIYNDLSPTASPAKIPSSPWKINISP